MVSVIFRENEVDKNYIAEIQIGPTNSLKSISYEIDTGYKEISATVQEVQADITRIRNRFKERMVYLHTIGQIREVNCVVFIWGSRFTEIGRQSRTREGYLVAEILGRPRHIKNELRGGGTKSK